MSGAQAKSKARSPGATLADVAAAAGVSPATVSRYFNTPDLLSPATVERVRLAVEKLDYVPNLVAGGLASNRTRLIAAIVPSISQSIFASTIQAMTDALSASGYSVMLGLSGLANERMDQVLNSVLGRRPDGIILTDGVAEPVARRQLIAAGIPIIETWDLPAEPIDMVVGFSHEAVGVAVAEHVLARGRQRPLLIATEGRRSLARQRGFIETFRRQGLAAPSQIHFPGAASFGHGRRGLARFLDGGGDPDVVVCSSDWSALGVLAEAQRRGLDVPGALGVVGFGDLDFAAETAPALTTVRIDGDAIGRQAAAFLLARAEGRPTAQGLADVGFELILRDSG